MSNQINIYGSSRLGTDIVGRNDTGNSPTNLELQRATKKYELTNHLGNVLATVSDRKYTQYLVGSTYTAAEVLSSSDYYPFGLEMMGAKNIHDPTSTSEVSGRVYLNKDFVNSGFRYGFNGKEKDPDFHEDVTNYDYGFRIYNPGIARFLSVDPLTKDYPFYTPYQFAGNMPVWAIDLEGLEPYTISGDDGNVITNESSITQENYDSYGATATRTGASQDNTSVTRMNLNAFNKIQDNRAKTPDSFWKFNIGGNTRYSTTDEVYSQASYGDDALASKMLGGDFGMDHARSFMKYDVMNAVADWNEQFANVLLTISPPMWEIGSLGPISKYGWKGVSYGRHQVAIGYRAETGIGVSYRNVSHKSTIGLDYHTLFHYGAKNKPVLHGHFAQKGVSKGNAHLMPSFVIRNYSALRRGMSTQKFKRTNLYKNMQKSTLH